MTDKELRVFCGTDQAESWLLNPFLCGSGTHVCATDRRILCAVRLDSYAGDAPPPLPETSPNTGKWVQDIIDGVRQDMVFVPAALPTPPEYDLQPMACPECHGHKKEPCKECLDGRVTWRYIGHHDGKKYKLEGECPVCRGASNVCRRCRDRGTIPQVTTVEVHGRSLQAKYVRMLATIKGLEIAEASGYPTVFRFPGGFVFCMEVKEP